MRVCVKLVNNEEYLYVKYKFRNSTMQSERILIPRGSIKRFIYKEPEENKEITILIR